MFAVVCVITVVLFMYFALFLSSILIVCMLMALDPTYAGDSNRQNTLQFRLVGNTDGSMGELCSICNCLHPHLRQKDTSLLQQSCDLHCIFKPQTKSIFNVYIMCYAAK